MRKSSLPNPSWVTRALTCCRRDSILARVERRRRSASALSRRSAASSARDCSALRRFFSAVWRIELFWLMGFYFGQGGQFCGDFERFCLAGRGGDFSFFSTGLL